jgi:uncharacterized membrane protein required for colicin V production
MKDINEIIEDIQEAEVEAGVIFLRQLFIMIVDLCYKRILKILTVIILYSIQHIIGGIVL